MFHSGKRRLVPKTQKETIQVREMVYDKNVFESQGVPFYRKRIASDKVAQCQKQAVNVCQDSYQEIHEFARCCKIVPKNSRENLTKVNEIQTKTDTYLSAYLIFCSY